MDRAGCLSLLWNLFKIFSLEKGGLLVTACTHPNVISSVYMEVFGLHKGSLCPPERSRAAWDHTEGASCLCRWPVPLHTPTSSPMTEQFIDNRETTAPCRLSWINKQKHIWAFIILFWFVMNERGSRRLMLSCFFPEASVFIWHMTLVEIWYNTLVLD